MIQVLQISAVVVLAVSPPFIIIGLALAERWRVEHAAAQRP